MSEGGANVQGSLLEAGAIDLFVYFSAPKVIGGGLSSIVSNNSFAMVDAVNLHNLSYCNIGNDLLVCGYANNLYSEAKNR